MFVEGRLFVISRAYGFMGRWCFADGQVVVRF